MKNNELVYEWLEFMSLQKGKDKVLFKEQVYKASATNPGVTSQLGDFEYELIPGEDKVKIISGEYPLKDVSLVCANGQKAGSVKFHEKYVNNLLNAFKNATQRSGYCPKSVGGYNARKVRKPGDSRSVEQRPLSNHSFGIAVDFDPNENPYSAGKVSIIEQNEEFIKAFEEQGFVWLGDGPGRSGGMHVGDDMHFQININTATSAELAADSSGDALAGTDFENRGVGGERSFLQDIGVFKESKDNVSVFSIKDKTDDKIYKKYKKYFDSLLSFLKDKLKITKPVLITFEEDKENSKEVLGRTGGYINDKNKIHIFATDRHIKDVLRSLAHEMVHHRQNIRGEFKNHEPTTKGYAQSNKHLRKMEKEAFLKGNILFRDWEDNYKYRGEK